MRRISTACWYLKGLKSADGGLREDVAVEGAEGKADVGLGKAELDSSLFELTSKSLEVVRRRRLQNVVHVVRHAAAAAITVSGDDASSSARRAVGTRSRVGHLQLTYTYTDRLNGINIRAV